MRKHVLSFPPVSWPGVRRHVTSPDDRQSLYRRCRRSRVGIVLCSRGGPSSSKLTAVVHVHHKKCTRKGVKSSHVSRLGPFPNTGGTSSLEGWVDSGFGLLLQRTGEVLMVLFTRDVGLYVPRAGSIFSVIGSVRMCGSVLNMRDASCGKASPSCVKRNLWADVRRPYPLLFHLPARLRPS